MSPNLPFAMIAVAAGVGLIITAIFLHARALDRRLPTPRRRTWWEGRRQSDVEAPVPDPEPRPTLMASDPPRYPTPSHRRVFNPGRLA